MLFKINFSLSSTG